MELHSITFPGLPDPYKVAPASHLDDKNNPHGVTPEQIGAAPAGYGLGSVAGADKWNGDANALTKQGWYRLESGTTNGVGESASLRVDGYAETGLTQTAYTRSGFKRIRTCVDGVWSEWEWVNPPMALGVEYRTTERCEGKPVYAKRINCLAAPASVSISDLNIDKVVRWSGFVTYYGVALPCSSATWKVDINRTTISTTSAYEQASAHFYIDLYYTKN